MKQRKKYRRNPRVVATEDIKAELRKQGKCFIAFRVELNPIMKQLLQEYLKEQKEVINHVFPQNI